VSIKLLLLWNDGVTGPEPLEEAHHVGANVIILKEDEHPGPIKGVVCLRKVQIDVMGEATTAEGQLGF